MKEVIPRLRDCYEHALPKLANPNLDITASFDLTGDPDIGTLIDAHELHDDHGTPLPAELDDCLRATLQSLELPPLTDGGQIEVRYGLQFRPDGPD
jgi:hypothetical protein